MKTDTTLGQTKTNIDPYMSNIALAAGAPGECEPWAGLLASAGPRDHIVQLYQDQQFLNRAVCRFAAGAIANGEGVILVPTAAHWEAFRPSARSRGRGR